MLYKKKVILSLVQIKDLALIRYTEHINTTNNNIPCNHLEQKKAVETPVGRYRKPWPYPPRKESGGKKSKKKKKESNPKSKEMQNKSLKQRTKKPKKESAQSDPVGLELVTSSLRFIQTILIEKKKVCR